MFAESRPREGVKGQERAPMRKRNYYAAFVLDPDGNNIEAVFRGD